MKTYKTDEVLKLVTEWIIQKSLLDGIESFPIWLRDREQSEIPVKGQMIWVRDNYDTAWVQRVFDFIDKKGKIRCLSEDNWLGEDCLVPWDEYSLTDPNE